MYRYEQKSAYIWDEQSFLWVKDDSIMAQAEPFGVVCGSSLWETERLLRAAGQDQKAHRWLPDSRVGFGSHVPGGGAIDWAAMDRAWVEIHFRCRGWETGGGPPECAIRIRAIRVCAQEKWYESHAAPVRNWRLKPGSNGLICMAGW